jgi:hypothetical protein
MKEKGESKSCYDKKKKLGSKDILKSENYTNREN